MLNIYRQALIGLVIVIIGHVSTTFTISAKTLTLSAVAWAVLTQAIAAIDMVGFIKRSAKRTKSSTWTAGILLHMLMIMETICSWVIVTTVPSSTMLMYGMMLIGATISTAIGFKANYIAFELKNGILLQYGSRNFSAQADPELTLLTFGPVRFK